MPITFDDRDKVASLKPKAGATQKVEGRRSHNIQMAISIDILNFQGWFQVSQLRNPYAFGEVSIAGPFCDHQIAVTARLDGVDTELGPDADPYQLTSVLNDGTGKFLPAVRTAITVG